MFDRDPPAERVVVDLGNTRIKLAVLGGDDRISAARSFAWDARAADRDAWRLLFARMGLSDRSRWAVASVNPPAAERLAQAIAELGGPEPRWYRSAADVPIATSVSQPERAGADRALCALAGSALATQAGPGLVISCGTAMTFERIDPDGVWVGGAIAPGLALGFRSLNLGTAQIPLVDSEPSEAVAPWGTATEAAVRAGVWWGAVGAARELIARQGGPRWRIWTGGDAPAIASEVEPGGAARVVPDLVLRGLAIAAFGASAQAVAP